METWTVVTFGDRSEEFVGEEVYNVMLPFVTLEPASVTTLDKRVEYYVNPCYVCDSLPECLYVRLTIDQEPCKLSVVAYHDSLLPKYSIQRSGIMEVDYNMISVSVHRITRNSTHLLPDTRFSDVAYIISETSSDFEAWGHRCRYILQKKQLCPLKTDSDGLYFDKDPVYKIELWIDGLVEKTTLLDIVRASSPRPLRGYFNV